MVAPSVLQQSLLKTRSADIPRQNFSPRSNDISSALKTNTSGVSSWSESLIHLGGGDIYSPRGAHTKRSHVSGDASGKKMATIKQEKLAGVQHERHPSFAERVRVETFDPSTKVDERSGDVHDEKLCLCSRQDAPVYYPEPSSHSCGTSSQAKMSKKNHYGQWTQSTEQGVCCRNNDTVNQILPP